MKPILCLASILILTACGGGGGGSDGNDGGGGGTPVRTSSGLIPAAPSVGAILTTDAAVLRPIRDQAVWVYRGLKTDYPGAPTVSYENRSIQATTGGSATTESFSNSANTGPDTQGFSISDGTVRIPLSIDFAGQGNTETVPFIELRSPVREDDQFTIWDRHYADTNIDSDGDRRADALDAAIYGRVMGVETLSLPGLPSLTTVRVDITLRSRITLSSNGQVMPVAQTVIQTWYARGIGIVRQRSSSQYGSDATGVVVDEQLSSWDGLTEGFGAMDAQTTVVPMSGDPFSGMTIRGAASFSNHALVVMADYSATDSTIARLNRNGEVFASRIQPNMPAGSEGLVVPHRQGLLYLRQGQTQSALTSTVEVTRFDAEGALVGNVAGATIDLTGPRTNPMLEQVKAVVDGTTLWLLWQRIYNTPTAQERELILRPYGLDGVPLGPELLVDTGSARAERIASVNGRVLLSWGRVVLGVGWEPTYASVALGDSAVIARPFASVLPTGAVDDGKFPYPASGGAWGALVWTAQVPNTAYGLTSGTLLDSNQSPIRSGSNLEGDVLPGVPMLRNFVHAPAINGTPDGALLVLSADSTVSWVATSANAPISTRPMSQVSLTDTTIAKQVVFDDRVLVLSSVGARLKTVVVWLNSGVAP